MFNVEGFEPKENRWLQLTMDKRGQGWVRFKDPAGTIKGITEFHANEFGEISVDLNIDKVETENNLLFGTFQLIQGGKVTKNGNKATMGIGGGFNEIVEFEITTPDGILSAKDNIYLTSTGNDKITFSALRVEYSATQREPAQAKYWAMPLSNFIPKFNPNRYTELNNHPLRIFHTPDIPENLTNDELFNASRAANKKNNLIVFDFNQTLGFIEPVSNFEEQKEKLLSRKSINEVTTVIVGEVGENSINSENLNDWFPHYFLLLLGLAGGNEVGSPWIEFRDKDGKLVKRIFEKLGYPSFSKGHEAINERFHKGGIGYLLSRTQISPEINRSFLNVALKNIVRAGLHSASLENRLRYVFLVFENLIEEYALRTEVHLREKNKKIVNAAISGSTKVINELARQARENNDELEAKLLARIANQIGGAKKIVTGFGLNVISLLEMFDLADHEIVEEYYIQNPRQDKRKWSDVVPYYRGIVMHRGYFSFHEGKHDLEEVYDFLYHLHDILLRIVFSILKYDGTYQPSVIKMTADEPITWVTKNIAPSRLGYGTYEARFGMMETIVPEDLEDKKE